MANSVFYGPFGFINNGTNIIFPTNIPFDYQATGLGTTSTDGGILENITAATAGVTVQISPRMRLRGTAWDTAASETVDFFMENLPATAGTPTGTLKFGYSLAGGAATYPLTLSSGGLLSFAGGFSGNGNSSLASGNLNIANGATYYWATRSQMTSPADGQWNLNDTGASHGFGFDFTTDAVAKLRTRAQTGYATLDCLGLKASGVAGVSFGPSVLTSITIVNGIVTAAS